MTTTLNQLIEAAHTLGVTSAKDFEAEFGEIPSEQGAEKLGDWDSVAWTEHDWRELKGLGCTDSDHESCLAAWRKGFWGT